MKVWAVIKMGYIKSGDNWCDVEIFSTYDAAKKFFDNSIQDETGDDGEYYVHMKKGDWALLFNRDDWDSSWQEIRIEEKEIRGGENEK